jgi:hypothetical protein
MKVFVKCPSESGPLTVLLDVNGYGDLKQQVEETFARFLDAGMELDVYYTFPYRGEHIDVSVRCEKGLETFFKLCREEKDAIPATLFVRECPPLAMPSPKSPQRTVQVQATESPAPTYAPAEANGQAGPRKSALRKSARPGESADASAPSPTSAEPEPNGPPKVEPLKPLYTSSSDPYANHSTAQQLLQSFRPSDPEPPSSLRAILRDGVASALVPFNAYNPPGVERLYKLVQMALSPKIIAMSDAVDPASVKWLVSATSPHSDNDVDLDDDNDVMFVGNLVKKYGELEVQLIVDLVNADTGSPHRYRAAPESTILNAMEHGYVEPEYVENLQVNLVHTPQKVKMRQKELDDIKKKEAILSGKDSRSAVTVQEPPKGQEE